MGMEVLDFFEIEVLNFFWKGSVRLFFGIEVLDLFGNEALDIDITYRGWGFSIRFGWGISWRK